MAGSKTAMSATKPGRSKPRSVSRNRRAAWAGQVGHRLGPGIIAELAGVITQVAGERPPAARVGEAAAEDAVGARHVRGMSKDRPDVGLGLITRHGSPRFPPPCPRPSGSRKRSRPDHSLACSAAAGTVCPSAHCQSGFATIAIVICSRG